MESSRRREIELSNKFAGKHFAEYYKKKSSTIEKWLDNLTQNKLEKNDKEAEKCRATGNKYFLKKDYDSCLYYYTKSLCLSEYNSESYSLALSNRSAVLWEISEYIACITDIERCLGANYPKNVYLKVLSRKCDCYHILNDTESLKSTLDAIKVFTESSEATSDDKKKFAKINARYLDGNVVEGKKCASTNWKEHLHIPPSLLGLKCWRSESITVEEKSPRGRRVVASKKITRGQILFVEKAAFFAPVFTPDSKEFSFDKCFSCLKDARNGIPCKKCTACVYCDENCRDSDTNHKWECEGMNLGVWHELGVTFPAWKALLVATTDPNAYDKIDDLLDHLRDTEFLEPILDMVLKTVKYLERRKFFDWLQSVRPFEDVSPLNVHVGGVLTRLVLQIMSNASVIEHWMYENNGGLPMSCKSVACGMFPAVSAMNHSCKPNVGLYYVDDVVVVAASEDLNEGEEVFNSYGVDYRVMDRETRRAELKELHFFECDCVVCANPSVEIENLDRFKYDGLENDRFVRKQNLFLQYLSGETNETKLEMAEMLANEICSPNHNFLLMWHDKSYKYYFEIGEIQKGLTHAEEALQIYTERMGKNSRGKGLKMYDILLRLISISFGHTENTSSQKRIIAEDVCKLYDECKEILQLYYPSVQALERLKEKIDLIYAV